MTFVGRTFDKFQNINMIQPQESLKLSQILKDHHIYIFCSKLEACSNSLLEAIHCGLAIIARNSSSNPELIQYFRRWLRRSLGQAICRRAAP